MLNRSARFPRVALLFGALLLLASCGPKEETGPGEVHWDREVCERCRMALSDPHYSAQVRGGPATERTRLYLFDDLGCAVLWLDGQDWKEDPRTEIWVNDCETGTWLDARKAHYLTGKVTPMDFGLGARPATTPGATLTYNEAVAHIYEMRERKKAKKAGMAAPMQQQGEDAASTQPAESEIDWPAPVPAPSRDHSTAATLEHLSAPAEEQE